MSLRRHVLAALAHGISVDDELEARAALDHIDPVLRGPARSRLGRALLDAELAIATTSVDRPSRVQIMRVAALAVANRPASIASDIAAVTAAYAELPPVTPSRAPTFTLVLVALLLAAAGAFTFVIVNRHPVPRSYVRPLATPTAVAFTSGGVPLHEPAIDAALEQPLTELVVKAGRVRHGEGETAFATSLAGLRTLELGHGAPLTNAWQRALDAYGAAVAATQLGATDRDRDALREAVRELTEQFAKAGLGYFLEGRFKNGFAYLQAYRVEEVVFVVTNGTPRRVLSLSRIDHLNTAYAVLGMQDENVGDPVLHLERIAEYVATTELPVLAPDARYALAEDAWLAEPVAKKLATAAGVAIRREYTAVLGADADASTQIAKLLVERGTIIEQWRDHLEKKHIVFSTTDELFVPPSLLEALDGGVPHYQLERVEAIDAELAELEAPRIHARVHDLVAATVRRHEAQHGFDYDREVELRYPAPLQDILGSPHDNDGNEVAIVASARAELSGYLSQIINDPITPHASLWHLGAQTFTRNRAGTGEFYAGIVVLEGLAKQLGADTSGRTFSRGLDRERLATLALPIAASSDDKLREAATKLWVELYGEQPTRIVDRSPTGVVAAK